MDERLAARAFVVVSIYNSCRDAFHYISSFNYFSVINSIKKEFLKIS